MSYEDPYRNDQGQFHNLGLPGATQWEQEAAGVNRYDDFHSANLRVRNRRAMLGLDEFTGQPVNGVLHHGGYGGEAPGGSGLLGAALWATTKWVLLWPLALLSVGVAVLAAAAVAEKAWSESGPGRGLAAAVLAEVAPDYVPRPPTAYLSAKQISSAPKVEDVFRNSGARAPTQGELVAAYLCQVNPRCARDAERASGTFISSRAAMFLVGQAKRGNATAGVEACLSHLATGARIQPIFVSRVACANARVSGAAGAATIERRLNESWIAVMGRAVEAVADAFCLDIRGPFCRIVDAPGKLMDAALMPSTRLGEPDREKVPRRPPSQPQAPHR